ncbi:MAG: hypothetical protein HFI72_05395 [Peptococcaceae bacterium]|jgi:energy-coupling factor transport system permease protein|nr:hypothetical protein [Peptococcaceae bacterium]
MDWGIAKLHPLVLLCVLGAWLFAMFFYAQSPYGLLLAAFNLIWYFWRRGRQGVAALKWYLLLTAVTVLFNLFFYNRGREILFYFFGRPVLKEGLLYGLYMGVLLLSLLLFWQVAVQVFPRDKWLWLWRKVLPQTAMVFLFSGGIFARCKKNMEEKWQILAMGKGARQDSLSLRQRCKAIGDSLYAFAGWSIQWGMETVDSVNSRGYGLCHGSSVRAYPWQWRDTLGLICWLGAFGCFFFGSYRQWPGGSFLFILGMIIFLFYWEGKEGRIWRNYTK